MIPSSRRRHFTTSNTRRVRPRRMDARRPFAPPDRPSTDGAGLSFLELQEAEPQQAAPETHIPIIPRVSSKDPNSLTLVNASGSLPSSPRDALPSVAILNADETAAYSFLAVRSNLKHDNEIWGEIWSSARYTKTETGTYKISKDNVAIKKLNKTVVDAYLARGRTPTTEPQDLIHIGHEYLARVLEISGRENPYREMSRMDEIGDNIHVLRQIEFLQDDHNIYIVMPHACELGSLDYVAFNRESPMPATEAQRIWKQILEILTYLERHNIQHRDVSPDNFLFLTPDRLVLMDFAMSVRTPVDEGTGQRTLIHAMGRFGTPPFMAPEAAYNFRLIDGVAIDLWAAVLILYSMLTKTLLYERPNALDVCFRYFIIAGGITNDSMNEHIVEVLNEVFDDETGDRQEQSILNDRAKANLALTPDSREIFSNVLQVNPARRWTLSQVKESKFCTRPQG